MRIPWALSLLMAVVGCAQAGEHEADEAATAADVLAPMPIRNAFHPAPEDGPLDAPHKRFAPYDQRCNGMRTRLARIDPLAFEVDAGYFDRPIERRVHQIWFGDANAMAPDKPALWRQMAEQFGYDYRLWNESDLPELLGLMPEANGRWLRQFLRIGAYHSASDIVRVSLLEQFGGVYVDVDMAPPKDRGQLVDLARVLPMRNVVLMTEVNCRNMGAPHSLFVANGFFLACRGHPLLRHLVASMPTNIEALEAFGALNEDGRGPAEFLTGPFFLTRSLAGAITVVPFSYMKRLGIL